MAKRQISAEREAALTARARYLREDGWTWKAIAVEIGIGNEWIKRRLVPGYAAISNEKVRKSHAGVTAPNFNRVDRRERKSRKDRIAEFEAQRELIADTRDFTQRWMGDPLPGRSALDQKRRA